MQKDYATLSFFAFDQCFVNLMLVDQFQGLGSSLSTVSSRIKNIANLASAVSSSYFTSRDTPTVTEFFVVDAF